MIKVSRNFCRYSSLLSYYEYYINKTQESNTELNNNFYLHLTEVIKNVFTILHFIYFVAKIVKNDERTDEDKYKFKLFEDEIYKKIITTYNIFSDKNFDLTNDILQTFRNYLESTNSLKELFTNISQNENIIEILDINTLFFLKYSSNLIEQIINEIDEGDSEEMLISFIDIKSSYKKSNDFCGNILKELSQNSENVRREISIISEKWAENRIHLIEKIIIGLAICEYNVYKTPIQVVINEYINISKEFCGEKSSIFINGVLDPILKKIQTNNDIYH